MENMQKSQPLYKVIEDYLTELIKQNSHVRQYKLPSENQLAFKFKCSRITVQRALENLQNKGVIYRVQGKGTFARESESTTMVFTGTPSVCMLLPDIERLYSREIINGANEYLYENGVELYVSMTNNDASVEKEKIENAVSRNHAGLILFPVIHRTYHEALLRLALSRYPMVLIGHSLPGLNFSSVHCDYYRQLYDMVNHLADKGHKHIGFITEMSQYNTTFEERIRGYQDCIISRFGPNALHSTEIDFYPETEQTLSERTVLTAISEYFADNRDITALVTTNLALEYILAYIEAHDASLKHIQLVVLDRPENLSCAKGYNISIIDQNPRFIGRQAAEQLLGEIRGERSPQEIITKEQVLDFSALCSQHI